ncbi:MAG: HAD-IA family hydrolase [Rhodocyclaceae bacterium]|nr:HAD-IA family hydrolase [Rhodocyclaceae bacterium]
MAAASYDLIVFDWDGTVVDSAGMIAQCIVDAADAAGAPRPTLDTARHVIGLGLDDALAYCFPGQPRAVLQGVVEHYKRLFLSRDAHGQIQPFAGARELLAWLSTCGAGLAVATGKSRAGLARQFGTTGLGPLFHGSRCADETHPKPHPAMLLELMDEFGALPARTLMVGDTSHDRLMAESAGTGFVGVTFGAHPLAALQGPATLCCCDDWAQLEHWLRPAD